MAIKKIIKKHLAAPAIVWGVNLLLCTAIGSWWMYIRSCREQLTILGALMVTFSEIVMAQVGRAIRLINI